MNSIPAKDTIYVDVDDEITTIIDKVRSSQSRIVALVLPKRATTLQSIVNMKLLKHSAEQDKKHLVLITAEAGILPLAASVGLYVAKNLQSKPEIPELNHPGGPIMPDDEEESLLLDDAPLNKSTPIGELAGDTAPIAPAAAYEDTINLDNTSSPSSAGHTPGLASATGKGKKNKKLSIPNFNKFRLLLIAGGAAVVVLIVGSYLCFSVLPKASILVETNSTAVSTTMDVLLSSSTNPTDINASSVPANSQQVAKTLTQQAPATGQQNNGVKAVGTVNMTAGSCSGTTPADIASGTGVSSGGQTFIIQGAVSFNPSLSGKKCTWQGQTSVSGKNDIPVAAQNPGTQYNVGSNSSPVTFTVAGRSDVSATGYSSGGTDAIVKIVQQSDIDGAKNKLGTQDTTAIKQQLQTQLTNAGYDPIAVTFTAGDPAVTTSVPVGSPADSVTVTEVVNYTMLGAKKSDLKILIGNAVKKQIDTKKQSVTDYGVDNATFKLQSGNTVSMHATAIAGPVLNADVLRKQVAGKKTGDATTLLKSNPGVTDVTITYSPFWVTSIPKNANKVTLVIDKPQKTTNANANSQ